MTKSSGAARQARQRAKGRQVAVILPQPAAEALDAICQQLGCTQAQAIARALLSEATRLLPYPSQRAFAAASYRAMHGDAEAIRALPDLAERLRRDSRATP